MTNYRTDGRTIQIIDQNGNPQPLQFNGAAYGACTLRAWLE